MTDKTALIQLIIADLQFAIRTALAAADEARATATNKENKAENRYDTLGLEAAYLAHGQSDRVIQLNLALVAFQNLDTGPDNHIEAKTGSLVSLRDEVGTQRAVFIGPAAGGQLVNFEGTKITIVTQQSPLGRALLGASCGDEVAPEIAGKVIIYTLIWLC